MLRYRLSGTDTGSTDDDLHNRRFRKDSDPFEFGGPLQMAVRGDLDQLFHVFAAIMRRSAKGNAQKEESAFVVFKAFFKKHKVALLHHLAPPRSDLSAYSQLLYAVCLSMIRDAFTNYEITSTAFFEYAAYATFLLYTLYQTNPLPAPPVEESLKGQLEILPFGLFDRRNPRESVYARHYHAPIRIDTEHYGFLLRILDLAAAGIDRTGGGFSSLLHNLRSMVQLIISTNMLEFCAYTGPCSLEGLAGHELYDAKDYRTKPDVLNIRTDSVPSLKDRLKQYQACLKSIRLPAVTPNMSNQSKRIRSLLEPVFSNTSIVDRMLEFANGQQVKTLKQQRHVSFGAVTIQRLEDSDSTEKYEIPAIQLPNGTSAARAESIRLAIRTLAERGKGLLLPDRESTAGSLQSLSSATSAFTHSASSKGSTPVVESNVGGQALRLLLEQSKQKHYETRFLSAQLLAPTVGENSESPERIVENLADALGAMSDLSSDEEQDEVSTTISRVGQSALQDLLKAASGGKPRTKKRKETPTKLRRKKRHRAIETKSDIPGDVLVNQTDPAGDEESLSHQSTVAGDASTGTRRHTGMASTLRELLKQANKFHQHDGNRTRSTNSIDESVPIAAPAAKRSQPSDDSCCVDGDSLTRGERSKSIVQNDHESVCSDMGRAALQGLLKRVEVKGKQPPER